MTDKIVMRDSPEAAEYRTGLSGWVSRRGLFYGDRPDSEDMARYDGCTHVACKYCSAPAQKSYAACQECRDKKDLERFEALPRADWDGKAMLYSEARDKYYAGPDDAEDELEEGETLAVRHMSAISDATLTGFEATFTTAAATVVSAFEKYVINTLENENSGSDFTQT